MRNRLAVRARLGIVCGTISLLLCSAAAAQEASSPLTLRASDGHGIHIFPTVNLAPALPPDSGPLVYNGGPVMQASVSTYAIFWIPASGKLQNGGATSMTAHYQTVNKNMLGDYPGHGLDNNNTQYYQISSKTTQYIQNKGGLAASYVDTDSYPSSGCSDSATPGNCITDAQLETELQKVMTLKGWTGGLNKVFEVFTSSGEGSCFDSSSSSCAYVQYCAYHSYYLNGSTPVVYSNEPFGDPSVCQNPGQPSPNSDPDADTAATAAAHELTEATTDPELDAWYTAQGNEIGDLCAYNYGTNTWDSAKANQMWNGRFYELQMMFSNHHPGCVQVGP